METSELLSIFIPTYKRHGYLQECLDSIIPQLKNRGGGINVYISNNSPNDIELNNIIKQYKETYSNIIYYENKENIGIDLNMAKAFEYPKSKYCLMLGDDDFLLKDSIDTIINKIQDIDVDFIVLNTNFYSLDNKITRKLLDIKKDEYITNPINGLENYGSKMPYGCLICNLESVKKLSTKKIYKYVGTSHLYGGVLWEMLVNKKCYNTALLISQSVIGMRKNIEKTWTEDSIDIYFNQIPLWSKKLPPYYRKVSNNSLSKYYKNTFKFRFLINILNSIDFNQRNIILSYNMPKYIRNRIKLILIFPVSFRNRLHNIYKRIKNIVYIN